MTMTVYSCPSLIAPSLLSCDLAKLAEDAQQMLDLGADWLVRRFGRRCIVTCVSHHTMWWFSTLTLTTLLLHLFHLLCI